MKEQQCFLPVLWLGLDMVMDNKQSIKTSTDKVTRKTLPLELKVAGTVPLVAEFPTSGSRHVTVFQACAYMRRQCTVHRR